MTTNTTPEPNDDDLVFFGTEDHPNICFACAMDNHDACDDSRDGVTCECPVCY